MEMMKKYYRNRYHSFLKALIEQNKKKDQEIEEVKAKEEKRKAKLQEKIGVANVQSRFLEEPKPLIEEKPPVVVEKKKKPKRGSTMAPMKPTQSIQNFNRTTKEEEVAVLDQSLNIKQVDNKSRVRSEKRARTPRAARKELAAPIDERTEEELEKEMKARKEAADKIKRR